MSSTTPSKPLPDPPRTPRERLQTHIANLLARLRTTKTTPGGSNPPADAPPHPLQTTLFPQAPPPPTPGRRKLVRSNATRRNSTFGTAMSSLRRRRRRSSDVRPGYFDPGARRDASGSTGDRLEMNVPVSAIPSILEEEEEEPSGQSRQGVQQDGQAGHEVEGRGEGRAYEVLGRESGGEEEGETAGV